MSDPFTMTWPEACALVIDLLDAIEPGTLSACTDIAEVTRRACEEVTPGAYALAPWAQLPQLLSLADQHALPTWPAGPTQHPCPPWCDKPTGHPYDTYAGGSLRRDHTHRFSDHASCATLELRERTTDPETGPSDLGTDPGALLVAVHLSDGTGYLSAAGARDLAAQLTAAADLYDLERSRMESGR